MYVQDLVQAQANARPDATAVAANKRRLTYGDLENRANKVASLLQSCGAGPGVIVGICMRRSVAFIVGALGALKAGAAYLPMDPADPAKWLGTLLEESGCHLVLTEAGVEESLPKGNWTTILLDQGGYIASCPAEGAAAPTSTAAELAYVIFTSGSTGRPKGIEITHANLLNLITWHVRTFAVSSADQATIYSSPAFDASVWEIWPYLAAGATVHIVDDSIRTRPDLLRNWMVQTGITIGFLPTPVAEAIIGLQWPAETSLRFLLTGADTLHRYPGPDLPFTLVNNYGPTECTVVATSGVVTPQKNPRELPSLGRAIQNVRAYIVDEHLNQVPDGSCGELLIGGEGVGRGYLNRPELTIKKFVRDPFLPSENGRVYRTGDLVRRLPDGQIMFLGRIDEQIKIRGYRVEPGEINAALNRQDGIQASFVAARTGQAGDVRLVAYIVTSPFANVQASALRNALSQCLPAHMVPAIFIRVTNLPLTRNGKVDRAALPEPNPENTLPEERFELPQTAVEQWLAGLLMQLLRIPRISRHDNFFRLGGHSLLGAQLIAKIDERFGVELSLRSLFDHPTVYGIASEIDGLVRSKINAMSDEEAGALLDSLSGGIAV
ncbi:MAG TPA: amino acid adenylation domain-containing protein [Candidatus Sulfotelmatobacter sp.]|nr:amino acid adenylation domain-containing protein [Candidatus Sulfotelmatobacter sp.]